MNSELTATRVEQPKATRWILGAIGVIALVGAGLVVRAKKAGQSSAAPAGSGGADARPIPVVITAFADKSFTFIMKTPPASILIKKAAGVQKGSKTPHTDKVGKLTRKQAEQIATTKMPDLTAADMDAAVRTIAGSARSMGITVEGV